MVRVIATTKGYFGGVVVNSGEAFECPDDLWSDEKRRPKWAVASDGVEAPQADSAPKADEGNQPKGKGRGKKAETVPAATAAPFADAPAPETIKGNGVSEALGIAPDWMPPSADDGKPVQADD